MFDGLCGLQMYKIGCIEPLDRGTVLPKSSSVSEVVKIVLEAATSDAPALATRREPPGKEREDK